jgi:hypothetical protein
MSATTATKNTKKATEVKEVKQPKEDKKPKKPITTDTESDNEPDVVLAEKPVKPAKPAKPAKDEQPEAEKEKARKPRTSRNNIFKPVGVKRPSLYTVFVKEYFAGLPKGTDKSVSQAAKEYSKIKDDDAKMAHYREVFAKLLQEYNNEYESQKQAAIDRGDFIEKKKRPMSAYMLFATSVEVRAHAKKHNLSVTDTAKYSGAQWKSMSEAEKDKYKQMVLANAASVASAAEKPSVALKKPVASKPKKPTAPVPASESEATTTDASSASESESATDSDTSSSSNKGKKKPSTTPSKNGKKQPAIVEETD